MKRIGQLLLAASLLAVPLTVAAQPARDGSGPSDRDGARREQGHQMANPGAVIAAEVAFNQLAQDRGQWTAFLETSAADAEMFVPQRVKAAAWLKKRPNPPKSVKWQPHEVWSSCDGSYAVTRGAWQQRDGTSGYFTTLWQRQPKGAGYKWLLDQGDAMATAIGAPEMILGLVADCPAPQPTPDVAAAASATPRGGRRGSKANTPALSPADTPALAGVQPIAISFNGDRKDGRSRDGTLDWTSVVAPDGLRTFVARIWKGGEMREVLRSEVNVEAKGPKPD